MEVIDKTLKFAAARVWPCIGKQICRNSLLKCGNSTNTSIICLPSCHFSMVMDKIHHVTTSLNTSLLLHHYHLLGPLTDAQFVKRYKMKASSKMKVKNMFVLSSIAFNVNTILYLTQICFSVITSRARVSNSAIIQKKWVLSVYLH